MDEDPYADINTRIEELMTVAVETKATLDAILVKIDEIQDQVKPAIDQLTGSSVFRMMFGGKK